MDGDQKLEFMTTPTTTITELQDMIEQAIGLKRNQYRLIHGSSGTRKEVGYFQRVWAYKRSTELNLDFWMVRVPI